MFKWLKEKGTHAVRKTCELNIRLNTQTLVTVANRAYANLQANGFVPTKSDQQSVFNAQEALLKDVMLGHANGLSLEDIDSQVITPALAALEVTKGAKQALDHVMKTAADMAAR
jgi:hypothetical protein